MTPGYLEILLNRKGTFSEIPPIPTAFPICLYNLLNIAALQMLLSPLLHQKSKQQREPRDLAAEKGLRRKGSQGKLHESFPRLFSLATLAPEVKHIQKIIPFVSWLFPFPFSPCDIPSIGQKALVICFCFYKGIYILLTGTVPFGIPGPGKFPLCSFHKFPLYMTKVGRSLPREQAFPLTCWCHQQHKPFSWSAGFQRSALCQTIYCGHMLPLEFKYTLHHRKAVNSGYKSYPDMQNFWCLILFVWNCLMQLTLRWGTLLCCWCLEKD